MVVETLAVTEVDEVFHALADPTRRDIVARAAQGEHSISSLARQYPMSVTAVQKHVAVLARAGLVTKSRRGREQIVRTEVHALRQARQALDELEHLWLGRIDRLGALLAERQEGEQA